jgi:hypothetical protein
MEPFIFDFNNNVQEFKEKLAATKVCRSELEGQEKEHHCAVALFDFLSSVEFSSVDDVKFALRYLFGQLFNCTLVRDKSGKPSGSHAVTLKCQNVYTKTTRDSNGDDSTYTCPCSFKISFASTIKKEGRFVFSKKYISVESLKHFFILENGNRSPCGASFRPKCNDLKCSDDINQLLKHTDNNGKMIPKSLKDKQCDLANANINISTSVLKKASAWVNKAHASTELEKMNLIEPLLELMQQSCQLLYKIEKNYGQ